MNTKTQISRHAVKRMHERFELDAIRAANVSERAWHKGKSFQDYADGKSKRYLQKASTVGMVARAFGNGIFIFNEQTRKLVTAYRMPKWFGQAKRKRYYVNDIDFDYAR